MHSTCFTTRSFDLAPNDRKPSDNKRMVVHPTFTVTLTQIEILKTVHQRVLATWSAV